MDVLKRTIDVGDMSDDGASRAAAALGDTALWRAHEQAERALAESSTRAERLAAAVARQRGSIEGAAERANQVATRAEGVATSAARVTETFERLGVIALNAGLEGARLSEPQGRALLLLSEEIRVNVRRGAEAAEQLSRVVHEIGGESAQVRGELERARAEVSEVGQEAAHLSASAQQATRSLDDLGARLRKATGLDPDAARTVALATEHARGLLNALSALPEAARSSHALRALSPLISPLARLLDELGDHVPEDEARDRTEGEP